MSTSSVVLIVVNLAWLIPFIYFMVRMTTRANADRDRRRRVLETGKPARAEILKVEQVGPYYSRVPHLLFRLRIEGAPTFETTAKGFFSQLQYPQLQAGMRIDVKYDPADQTSVAVVGDQLV